jgi:hypothetical protein
LNIALIEIYTFFYRTELTEERSTNVGVQMYITEIYDVDVVEMVRSHSLYSVPLSCPWVRFCLFCFVLVFFAIVLSVLLRITDSDSPFSIFKLFLHS